MQCLPKKSLLYISITELNTSSASPAADASGQPRDTSYTRPVIALFSRCTVGEGTMEYTKLRFPEQGQCFRKEEFVKNIECRLHKLLYVIVINFPNHFLTIIVIKGTVA